jgi:lincosamide and streptogramin A transport system ATP-binding/permease protein
MRDDFELAADEKLKKDIKRLESAARQSSQWADKVESTKMGKGAAAIRKKGHTSIDTMAYAAEKSRRMQQRRKNLERRQQSAIDEKSSLLKNNETAESLKIHPLTYHTSRLLSAENLTVSYDGREIFSGLNFTLEQGDRLALLGSNGSGKSSIIKLICGEDIPHTGFINIGSRLMISYVPQDASFLVGDLDEYVAQQQIDMTLFKTILRKLDFSRVQFEKDMRDYSAGQKKKVLLARSLCQQAHIYVWDEPLNFIDVLSRMQIEELISDYCPTMIFVEHDQAFCENIATKTIRLTGHVAGVSK